MSAKINVPVYTRIISYIKKYTSALLLCVALSFVISFLHFGSLGMVKPLGDILFSANGSDIILKQLENCGEWGIWAAAFLKTYVFNNPYKALYIILVIALVLVVAKNLLRFFQEYLAGYITNKVSMDIANDLFAKVQKLPLSYFSKEGASQISARFMSDIPMMSKGLHSIFSKAIREPLKAIATMILALLINWELTLITCIVLPIGGIFLRSLGKKIKRNAKKTLKQRSNLLAILQETFTGIRLVKAYLMEQKLHQKFVAENRALLRYEMKVIAVDSATNPIMETFVVGAGVGVMLFSAHQVLSGRMTIGDFSAFYAALAALFDPIRKLADLNNLIATSLAGGERVFELMDVVPSIQDSPDAVVLSPVQKSICFEHVSFAYQPNDLVLKDLSFTVQHGEKIAIVGKSGAGKSTLISLLLRLYDVQEGAISFDGLDIRKVTMDSLRSQIGLVTQEAFLFNDTIAANIFCADPHHEDEAIYKAAQDAYADIFIQHLGKQYETLYGPGGIDLSGGQKHRIALARAIFKQPKILILDEAMANLDAESESYILRALETFTKGRTTFIIAHRFSTIQKVDRILVLDNGMLVGFGKHAELMKTSPIYQNLYELQALGGLPT